MRKAEQILNDISEHIENSYQKVEAFGGTIPAEKTLSNLSESIMTIPAPIICADLSYYSVWSESWEPSGYMCTVKSIDSDKLEVFLGEYGSSTQSASFSYQENVWMFYGKEGRIEIRPEDMEETTGIDVEVESSFAGLNLSKKIVVDETSPEVTARVNQEDFANFGTASTYKVGSLQIPKEAITGIAIKDNVTSTPTGLLSNCPRLKFCDMTQATELTTIGANFLSSSGISSQTITIPNGVVSIGDSFLSSCTNFNGEVELPASLESIGNYFLKNCYKFNQPLELPSSLTSIGIYFLSSSGISSQNITIPDGVVSIGDYFLYSCGSFNGKVELPTSLESIGNDFLSYCRRFNQPLELPSSLKTIGINFMHYCEDFSYTLTLPDGITSIGTGFLYEMKNFIELRTGSLSSDVIQYSDMTLTTVYRSGGPRLIEIMGEYASDWVAKFPYRWSSHPQRYLMVGYDVPEATLILDDGRTFSNLTSTDVARMCTYDSTFLFRGIYISKTNIYGVNLCGVGIQSIGSYFLYDSAVKKVIMDNTEITTIGNGFLTKCDELVREVILPDTLQTIGFSFMCQTGVKKVVFPDNITNLPNETLKDCTELTSVKLPEKLESIGNKCLQGCTVFNSSIIIPSGVTTIGNYFLGQCTALNSPITIPSGVTTIGDYFLSSCTNFNSEITLPEGLTTIGSDFLNNAQRFNQNLTLPSTLTSVGGKFMYFCFYRSSGVLYLGDLPADIFAESAESFATVSTSYPVYASGFQISGSYAQDLKTRFPDSSSSPYRKLVIV